jgi:hypothetical protein
MEIDCSIIFFLLSYLVLANTKKSKMEIIETGWRGWGRFIVASSNIQDPNV